MKIYSTYCSAAKKHPTDLTNAIDLYQSNRIKWVYELAKTAQVRFLILSGKYGLLKPDDPIQYYDHLLQADEVSKHSELVADQIKQFEISEIVFYANSPEKDPNLLPYINCISIAAEKANATIDIRMIDIVD